MKSLLKVNGLEVSCLRGGQDKDPASTHVFLHGWCLNSHTFSELLEILADSYPVIGVDLPGFGNSQEPNFWGYEAYSQFVSDLLKELQLDSVHLMGQSMGGGIALATAALFPKQVKSVVVMNSAGIPMREGQPSAVDRVRELWAQGFHAGIWKAFIANSLKHPLHLPRSLSVPVKHDLRPLLPRIKAPCLLAWGDCDKMLPLEFAYEMASLIPNARVAPVSGGYHEWGLMQPEIFCSLAKQFAASLQK